MDKTYVHSSSKVDFSISKRYVSNSNQNSSIQAKVFTAFFTNPLRSTQQREEDHTYVPKKSHLIHHQVSELREPNVSFPMISFFNTFSLVNCVPNLIEAIQTFGLFEQFLTKHDKNNLVQTKRQD